MKPLTKARFDHLLWLPAWK